MKYPKDKIETYVSYENMIINLLLWIGALGLITGGFGLLTSGPLQNIGFMVLRFLAVILTIVFYFKGYFSPTTEEMLIHRIVK